MLHVSTHLWCTLLLQLIFTNPKKALLFTKREELQGFIGGIDKRIKAAMKIVLKWGKMRKKLNEFSRNGQHNAKMIMRFRFIQTSTYRWFQYWSGLKLTEEERKIAYNELSTYVAGLFVLLLVFAVYNILEIYITRKYQKCIETSGEFIPVSRTDRLYNSGAHGAVTFGGFPVEKPIERPPPYNPDYAPAPPYRR